MSVRTRGRAGETMTRRHTRHPTRSPAHRAAPSPAPARTSGRRLTGDTALRDPFDATRHGHTSDSLARSGPRELASARAHRDHLLRVARILVVATGGTPGRPCPAGRACLQGAHDGVCGLVHRLAALGAGPVPVVAEAQARRDLDAALTAAVDAVRCCRQTDHALGRCWFTATAGQDGCAEVLRAAHGVG